MASNSYIVKERIFTTLDGSELSCPGDGKQRVLFASSGKKIPLVKAEDLGLTGGGEKKYAEKCAKTKEKAKKVAETPEAKKNREAGEKIAKEREAKRQDDVRKGRRSKNDKARKPANDK